ncbi:MAG: DJ-1/PfpI family protein [Clostridium sp.]|uniref:DJ-1/PfpI family protein n=1 Tax=Clostridium TaxID=1485 RepID=UPI0021522C99|nr:DJ-1/PfpI family protein [Clostridium sp. LY3-2]MCR6515639.1 DJ-1/PfpI family protein [Clostridium sp. LY3-2]
MKRIGIFIFKDMTDYHVSLISQLLNSSEGIEVVTLANKDGVIKARSGFNFIPDNTLRKIEFEELDGLIIPGGWSNDFSDELRELIWYLKDNNKLIAGICGAGTIALAKSGVFEKYEYTTPVKTWTKKHEEVFGGEDPFNRKNYVEYDVVRDCNCITADGMAFIDFSIEICDMLNLFSSDEEKKEFRRMFK